MKHPTPKPYLILLALLVVLSVCLPKAFAQDQASFTMSHQKIEVDSFYHGTNLVISGTAPADSRLALVLASEKKEIKLNRKGKVGPLWMNVGVVTVEGAPEMYYLFTSTPTIEGLGSREILERCCIGYDVLRKSVTIGQNDTDSDLIFGEFVKLKESMGLYKCAPGAISVEPADGKSEKFSATVPIPPLVPAGEYNVSVYCFKDDPFFTTSTGSLVVEKTGMPEKVSLLAFHYPAAYGVLAIVVAIVAGLSMGVLFGSRQKGGH